MVQTKKKIIKKPAHKKSAPKKAVQKKPVQKKSDHKKSVLKKSISKNVRHDKKIINKAKPRQEVVHETVRPTETQIKDLIRKGRSRGFIMETELLYVFSEIEEVYL